MISHAKYMYIVPFRKLDVSGVGVHSGWLMLGTLARSRLLSSDSRRSRIQVMKYKTTWNRINSPKDPTCCNVVIVSFVFLYYTITWLVTPLKSFDTCCGVYKHLED